MHVTVAPRPDGGGVLTVADDGPGFPAGADLSRGAGSGTSTGLGLDIARRTAESSGGMMTLCNATPAGALITLTFPAPEGGGAG
jgi:signal transduction histidine kinase